MSATKEQRAADVNLGSAWLAHDLVLSKNSSGSREKAAGQGVPRRFLQLNIGQHDFASRTPHQKGVGRRRSHEPRGLLSHTGDSMGRAIIDSRDAALGLFPITTIS